MSSETPKAEVNIPDEAKALSVKWWDGSNHEAFEMEGVKLILAAALDRLAEELDGARSGKDDDWDSGWHAALDYSMRVARRRASELRGEDGHGNA